MATMDVSAGGAMFLTGGTTILNDVAVLDSSAGGGGAIYVGPGATLNIAQANFFNNQATGKAFTYDKNGVLMVSVQAYAMDLGPRGTSAANRHF
jgi:hypothetical protein